MTPASSEFARSALVPPWACALIFAVSLTWMALGRWNSPNLDRPLDYDEWHTIEFYGWAGLAPSGDMKSIRRESEFAGMSSPNLRQLGLGLYRSAGTWKEPNNHVVHSVLVNLAVAVERSPRAARAPAFAAGALFAILVFALIGNVWRCWWAAPVIGLAAYALPYVEEYGATARGYTLVLALQTLFIIFVVLLAKRPGSIWLGAGSVLAAAGCFVSVVSLAVDWVLPAYAALWFFPPPGDRVTWRRGLTVQGLTLTAIFGVFAVDRLPALVVASQRFGDTLGSPVEVFAWFQNTLQFLFPAPAWSFVAVAGALGLGAAAGCRSTRFLAAVPPAVLLFNLLHFAITKRCPYPRVCGYFLPPILVGLGPLAQLAQRLLDSGGTAPRPALGGCLVLASSAAVVLVCPATPIVPKNFDVAENGARAEQGTYALVADFDYVSSKYLPDAWLTHQDTVVPATIYRLAFVVARDGDSNSGVWQRGSAQKPWVRPLPSRGADVGGPNFAALVVPARAEDYECGKCLPESDWLVVCWRPDQARVGLDPAPLMSQFDQYAVPFLRRGARLQANFDYYVRPGAFEMIAQTAEERSQLQALLEACLSNFGGWAVVFYAIEGGGRCAAVNH
jgi:hypothetical protein